MKKILLMVALASLCASVSAQKSADRKAARAAQKEYYRALDARMHDSAMKALQDSAFILKADKVTFRRGRIAYVSSTTNFVSMEGERAVIQLAFPNLPWPGANGLGGITVDGIVTNVSVKTDQKRFRALPDERRGFGNFVVDGRNRAQSVGQQGLRNGVSHVQQQSGDAQRRAGALRPAQRVQRPLAVLRRRSGTALLDCRPEALAGLMSGSCYCKLKPVDPLRPVLYVCAAPVREADEARTGDRATRGSLANRSGDGSADCPDRYGAGNQ